MCFLFNLSFFYHIQPASLTACLPAYLLLIYACLPICLCLFKFNRIGQRIGKGGRSLPTCLFICLPAICLYLSVSLYVKTKRFMYHYKGICLYLSTSVTVSPSPAYYLSIRIKKKKPTYQPTSFTPNLQTSSLPRVTTPSLPLCLPAC